MHSPRSLAVLFCDCPCRLPLQLHTMVHAAIIRAQLLAVSPLCAPSFTLGSHVLCTLNELLACLLMALQLAPGRLLCLGSALRNCVPHARRSWRKSHLLLFGSLHNRSSCSLLQPFLKQRALLQTLLSKAIANLQNLGCSKADVWATTLLVGVTGDTCGSAVKICSPLNKAFGDYRIASTTCEPCIDAGNMQEGSNDRGRGSSAA